MPTGTSCSWKRSWTKGIPLALYSDRHGIPSTSLRACFQRSPRERETLEEQLAGEREPTQFGRALRELGIQPIFALSPQAKGRIERLWQTLQDRLAAELRLAGASTPQEANRVLWAFLPRFNTRFGVPAAQPGQAYTPPGPGLDLRGVLCFKYRRTVATDNTVPFFGRRLQFLPGLDRLSYAHARVEVQERLDGSVVVAHQGQVIATQQAPASPVTLRARTGARTPARGSEDRLVVGVRPVGRVSPVPVHPPDHPWRKRLVTKSLNC